MLSLAFIAKSVRVNEDNLSLKQICLVHPLSMAILAALKGTHFQFLFLFTVNKDLLNPLTSSNSGYIGPPTKELAALEHLKIPIVL